VVLSEIISEVVGSLLSVDEGLALLSSVVDPIKKYMPMALEGRCLTDSFAMSTAHALSVYIRVAA
jgi:hypothetical protein